MPFARRLINRFSRRYMVPTRNRPRRYLAVQYKDIVIYRMISFHLNRYARPFRCLTSGTKIHQTNTSKRRIPFSNLLTSTNCTFPSFIICNYYSIHKFCIKHHMLIFILSGRYNGSLPLRNGGSSSHRQRPVTLILQILHAVQADRRPSLLFATQRYFEVHTK